MAADYGFPTDMETDVVGLEQDGILAEIKKNPSSTSFFKSRSHDNEESITSFDIREYYQWYNIR